MKSTKDYMISYWSKKVAKRRANGSSKWQIELETIMKTMNYTTRTFYVKADKIDTLLEFQEKCRNNGRRSYSEVLLELMENYNKNN